MNMNLAPVRHEEVEVCGATVLAVVAENGKAYFSPNHMCAALGIDWGSQYTKIKNDSVMSTTVVKITTVRPDGSSIPTTMLPIELLSGWLFTIKKVRPEVQEKLNQFRAEAFLALDAWFRKGLRNTLNVQGITDSKDFKTEPFSFLEKSKLPGGLSVFKHPMFGELRTTITDGNGEPWFVAKDVAEALGYANPSNAVQAHCKNKQNIVIPESGITAIIPERDMYRLVMRSKLPAAEVFEEWVVGEVLPSIRKTGKYSVAPAEVEVLPAETQATAPASLPEVLRMFADELEGKDRIIAQQAAAIRRLESRPGRVTGEKQAALPGVEEKYIRVRQMKWLNDYFHVSLIFCQQAGSELGRLSREMGLSPKSVKHKVYPNGINAYHADVVEAFQDKVFTDPAFLKKYRLGGAA